MVNFIDLKLLLKNYRAAELAEFVSARIGKN